MSLAKNIKVFGDVHLGTKSIKTENIIRGIDKYFNYYRKPMFRTDLIIIEGDLFDRPVDFYSREGALISAWIARFSQYCINFNIHLRVLEGTPSHDWKQSKLFNELQTPLIKYISRLELESIPELELDILYIPDEWNPSNKETERQVKKLLKDNNKEKVDFVVMHGHFDFQIPANIKSIPRHDQNYYNSIVNYYVLVGHDHHYKIHENIIATGSTDRLCHGEEDPKGFTEICVDKDYKKFIFIENHDATVFKTINLDVLNKEELDKLRKLCEDLAVDSRIRIKTPKHSDFDIIYESLLLEYPYIIFTKLTDKETNETNEKEERVEGYRPLILTKDNLTDLVREKLETLYENDITQKCLNLLEQIQHE